MAILFFESFEASMIGFPNSGKVNGTIDPASNNSYEGTYCARIQANEEAKFYTTTGSPTEIYAGHWCYYSGTATNGGSLKFFIDDGNYLHLRFSTSGTAVTPVFYVNTTSTSTGTASFPVNEWHHLEVYAKIDASVGKFTVKLDGTSVLDFTGNTKPGAGTYISEVGLHHPTGPLLDVDNLHIADAWTGQLHCHTMRPTSDSETTWTKSTGSTSYTLVDETSKNTSDYLSSTTTGQQEEWGTTGNFTDTNRTILAVGVTAYATGVNATESLKIGIDSGGTENASAAQALTNQWEDHYREIWNTDPNTTAAWANAAAVNAVKPFIESVIV